MTSLIFSEIDPIKGLALLTLSSFSGTLVEEVEVAGALLFNRTRGVPHPWQFGGTMGAGVRRLPGSMQSRRYRLQVAAAEVLVRDAAREMSRKQ